MNVTAEICDQINKEKSKVFSLVQRKCALEIRGYYK